MYYTLLYDATRYYITLCDTILYTTLHYTIQSYVYIGYFDTKYITLYDIYIYIYIYYLYVYVYNWLPA